jgi:hypothetical protein
MNPRILLSIIALVLSLQGLIPWLYGYDKAVPVLSIILLPVVWFLYRGKRGAFRFMRVISWIFFLLTCLFALMVVFSDSYTGLYVAHSRIASVVWYIGWTIALGGMLYYMDLDHVKAAFNVKNTPKPPQKESSTSM